MDTIMRVCQNKSQQVVAEASHLSGEFMCREADAYTPVELNRFGSAATWIFNSVLSFSGGWSRALSGGNQMYAV